jgi:hypothetical protein
MSIRIRVFPEPNSIGARRNRARKQQVLALRRQHARRVAEQLAMRRLMAYQGFQPVRYNRIPWLGLAQPYQAGCGFGQRQYWRSSPYRAPFQSGYNAAWNGSAYLPTYPPQRYVPQPYISGGYSNLQYASTPAAYSYNTDYYSSSAPGYNW